MTNAEFRRICISIPLPRVCVERDDTVVIERMFTKTQESQVNIGVSMRMDRVPT